MKRCLFSLVIFFFCISFVNGQGRTISGTVSDNTGALPGASIIEKGQPTNGTMTDVNGNFKLVLKGSGNTLVVSMIGYLQQEVNVAGKTSANITLKEDSKGLEEVVVVGYGTQKKVTVTGAVSQITGAEIRQNPSASIQNTLMGRLPGFTSQQRSGQPGSDAATFNIRGANSYTATASPLVIVDDMVYPLPLSDIDPDQVESITILKDASTTAVYGVKGADGVILITTRRGKSGKPQVSFRTETGFQSPTIPFDFLGSYDVARLRNQALQNVGQAPAYTQESLDHFRNGTDPYGHPDVNWAETILRKRAVQTRNNLNISGGTDKAKYFVTVGHLFQNGLMKDFSSDASGFNSNYYYKRFNFRSNIDIKATKTLEVGVDLSGYIGEQNNPWLRGTDNNPFFELYDYMRLPPFGYPIYNPDGSFGGNNSSQLARLAYNMVGRMTYLGYMRNQETGILTNVIGKQDLAFITKGLKARVTFGYNTANSYSRNLQRQAFPSYVYDPVADSYSLFDPATIRLPKMDLSYSPGMMNRRITFLASLDYDRTFNQKHHVYGLVLTNMFSRIPGATIPENFRGYTFRAGYDYKQKYIAELVAGYNGTDKFVTQKRYALFPAASIGWNIAEENFFKEHLSAVNMFKIRASYGLIGNDNVQSSTYVFEQVYYANTGVYSFGEVTGSTSNNASGVREGTLENLNIRWEQERSSNVGVDISAFNGKLKFTGDYFRRYRYDILRGRQSIPAYAGVSFPIANYASINTKGYELDLTYRNNIGQFDFSVNGNVSVAKSRIVNADEAIPEMAYQAQTGGYLGRVLGYVYDGFYTAENIDTSPKPGIPVAPGDLRYKDIDNDGHITPKDRVRLEYPNLPNTIYGFNMNMGYKGFSFSATFQAATNFTLRAISQQIVPFVSNLRSIHLDAWTPENQDASLPRLMPTWLGTVNDPNTYVSDFWNKRGDYLRLKTAEFNYSLPSALVKRIHLGGVRVYVNGSNLMTWFLVDKNIYNLDPESRSGSAIMAYPQQKIWNFGMQVSF